MLYLGIDGHSKWNRTEGFNPNTGETISMPKVSNNPDILKEEFSKLDGPLYGAMEAGRPSTGLCFHSLRNLS